MADFFANLAGALIAMKHSKQHHSIPHHQAASHRDDSAIGLAAGRRLQTSASDTTYRAPEAENNGTPGGDVGAGDVFKRLSITEAPLTNDHLNTYLRWQKVQKHASQLGKGLKTQTSVATPNCHALLLRAEHWLEVADDKHRYGSNLRPYFDYFVNLESDGHEDAARLAIENMKLAKANKHVGASVKTKMSVEQLLSPMAAAEPHSKDGPSHALGSGQQAPPLPDTQCAHAAVQAPAPQPAGSCTGPEQDSQAAVYTLPQESSRHWSGQPLEQPTVSTSSAHGSASSSMPNPASQQPALHPPAPAPQSAVSIAFMTASLSAPAEEHTPSQPAAAGAAPLPAAMHTLLSPELLLQPAQDAKQATDGRAGLMAGLQLPDCALGIDAGGSSHGVELMRSRDHFFRWLDYGEGRLFDMGSLGGPPRLKLESERVAYLSPEQLVEYLVCVDPQGRLVYQRSGALLHTDLTHAALQAQQLALFNLGRYASLPPPVSSASHPVEDPDRAATAAARALLAQVQGTGGDSLTPGQQTLEAAADAAIAAVLAEAADEADDGEPASVAAAEASPAEDITVCTAPAGQATQPASAGAGLDNAGHACTPGQVQAASEAQPSGISPAEPGNSLTPAVAQVEVQGQEPTLPSQDGVSNSTASPSSKPVKEMQKWIYVVDSSGQLYVHAKVRGRFHHSSFLRGGAVLAAGGMIVKQGLLTKLTGDSGHYHPTMDHQNWLVAHLKRQGADLSSLKEISMKHV